jgi:two-component system sensor kinase FixL
MARVSLLGELSASIAHELHQPLAAILCNAQAAQRLLPATPDRAEIRSIIDDIVADDRRAGLLISRLKASMTKTAPQRQTLHVPAIAEEALALARGELLTSGTTVAMHFAENLPLVSGDRIQLQQVLLNLIVNAARAQQNRPQAQRQITLGARRASDSDLQVEVRDRGDGIPPEQLTAVFEPFFTTKVDGLGMGLSICRTIVEDHGGSLWASNNLDQGATFHFTLPVAGDAGTDTSRLPSASLSWPRGTVYGGWVDRPVVADCEGGGSENL